LLAALDHGSMLGAARALGSSQPTLGRHIAELEAQLGVVLFAWCCSRGRCRPSPGPSLPGVALPG